MLRENRVNFVAPADYRNNTMLDQLVKAIMDKVAGDRCLRGFCSAHHPHLLTRCTDFSLVCGVVVLPAKARLGAKREFGVPIAKWAMPELPPQL